MSCRKLRRLRVTVIVYTCASLCALFLFISFSTDVKNLLQSSDYRHSTGKASARAGDFVESGPLEAAHDIYSSHSNEVQQGNRKDEKTLDYPLSPSLPKKQIPKLDPKKAWFIKGGGKFPPGGNSLEISNLWPEENPNSDRIVDQLLFTLQDLSDVQRTVDDGRIGRRVSNKTFATETVGGAGGRAALLEASGSRWLGGNSILPSEISHQSHSEGGNIRNVSASGGGNQAHFPEGTTAVDTQKLKTILLYYGLGMSWGPHITSGRNMFLQDKCPVNTCRLTGNRAHIKKADIVVFKDVFMNPRIKRPPHQLWAIYMLECPLNTQIFLHKNMFNMTATYRHDSEVVTPYEKWVYYDSNVKKNEQGINFAEGKTKKVAWFVSNCVAKNNRLEYARELRKYIDVDIFGACGSRSCSRANSKQCFDLLSKNYKFYLAFENSNCRDYISEKFFVNGLGNNVLPIVMGAHPDDYKRVAPEKSYIHVDDFASPAELAEYLHKLDQDDELYSDYFAWKGTGEFVNTHFFCRLCAMAHYADHSMHQSRHYEDFNKWWRGPGVCTRRSWRGQPDIFSPSYDRGAVTVVSNDDDD